MLIQLRGGGLVELTGVLIEPDGHKVIIRQAGTYRDIWLGKPIPKPDEPTTKDACMAIAELYCAYTRSGKPAIFQDDLDNEIEKVTRLRVNAEKESSRSTSSPVS